MAVRTTAAAVKAIVETDDSIDLTPFIETASSVVDDVCALASLGYSATKLELIERWLSAHFYRVRDMAVAAEGAGPTQETFQHRLGLTLQVTMYGQQAMLVDTKGSLAAFDKRLQEGAPANPGITYLGTDHCRW